LAGSLIVYISKTSQVLNTCEVYNLYKDKFCVKDWSIVGAHFFFQQKWRLRKA
jgi:hypothetical protein